MNDLRLCPNCMVALKAGKSACPACGYKGKNTNPQGALPVGTMLLNRYAVGKFLELDGEGTLYYGFDTSEMCRCVIKEFMPVSLCVGRDDSNKILPREGSEVLFKNAMMDFECVHKNIMTLPCQNFIVKTLNVVQANGTVYAITEYVNGEDLESYLENHGDSLAYEDTIALLMPVIEAVKTMHKNNFIHRGISPENIVITNHGATKLGGFATLALRTYGSEIKTQLYPGYSAPEQYVISEFQGTYTDVYAMAAVILRCITGNMPQPARERKQEDFMQEDVMNAPIETIEQDTLLFALELKTSSRCKDINMLLENDDDVIEYRGANISKAGEDTSISTKMLILTTIMVTITIIALIVLWVQINKNMNNSDVPITSDITSNSQEEEPTRDTVPYLTGDKYADVLANDEYSALYRFVVTEAFSDMYVEGEIISQDPKSGSVNPENGIINITVSKGKEKDQIEDQPVPDLKMMALSDAENQLNSQGIKYNIVMVGEGDGSVPSGYVKSTDKTPNSTIKSDETLNVYVVE